MNEEIFLIGSNDSLDVATRDYYGSLVSLKDGREIEDAVAENSRQYMMIEIFKDENPFVESNDFLVARNIDNEDEVIVYQANKKIVFRNSKTDLSYSDAFNNHRVFKLV